MPIVRALSVVVFAILPECQNASRVRLPLIDPLLCSREAAGQERQRAVEDRSVLAASMLPGSSPGMTIVNAATSNGTLTGAAS
jgi:hypothetical protein